MVGTQRTSWTFFSNLLIVALGVLLVGFVLVLGFGSVTGTQISPQTFEMRSYDYYRVPWTRLQITPVKYTKSRNLLVTHLKNEKTLPVATTTRWDEVVFRAAGAPEHRGRAWILASTLTMEDNDGANHWLSWSEDHPQIASVLWGYVSRAAEDGVYFVIPDLMDSAERFAAEADNSGNLTEVNRQLVDIMRTGYQQEIEALETEGSADQVSAVKASLARMEAQSGSSAPP